MLAVTALAGCGLSIPRVYLPSPVYLHSADSQKDTQQAKDDFDKICSRQAGAEPGIKLEI